MKKIYLLSKACLFTAAMFMFSACAEDEAVVTPVFPEGETVETVTPGTEYTLTFSANMNWELESSKPWCKFSNGFQSVKGEAGENISQKIVVTTDGMTLQDDIAEITLIMGDEEKVIAKYTRGGLVPSVTDFNNNVYGEENPLAFEYTNNGVESIKGFIANFSWRLTDSDLPEWIKINEGSEIGGNAGDKVQISFYVPEEYWLTAQEGTIKIKNEELGCEVIIPVNFGGMPDGVIRVTGLSSAWNWIVSQDGTKYWQKSQGSTEEETQEYNFPLTLNVLAKNNDYVVRFLASDDRGYMFIDSDLFYSYENNNEGLVVLKDFQENSSSSRKGYVLIFPKADYLEISKNNTLDDYNTLLKDDKDIAEEVSKYVQMSFEQEGVVQEGVTPIKINVNGEDEETVQGTGNIPQNVQEAIDQMYLADNANKDSYIFYHTVPKEAWVTITPFIKDYFGENSIIGKCSIGNFTNPTPESSLLVPEISGESYENSAATFQVNESLVVSFSDDYGMICKVLILHVN